MYSPQPLSLQTHTHAAFGNERRMPIQVSTLIPAHNALWVGTENGVLLSFPFTVPTMVAEEAGWEFIKVSYMYM